MIDLENISFDHCIKCTVCTAYCPVARATTDYPGPKASGPDTERLRIKNPELLDDSLALCSNCKRCEIACPSDVKIADIIQTAKNRHSKRIPNPRDFFMSRTDLAGSLATRAAPLVNLMTGLKPAKRIFDKFIGIPFERQMPSYERGTFHKWFESHVKNQARFSEQALYFTGCYVNYLDHELGRDMVRVANALGVGLRLAREKCCGVPLIANGFIEKAQKNARHNIKALSAQVKGKADCVVCTSSSCTYCLRWEYPNLLELDNSGYADNLTFVSAFVWPRLERLKPGALTPQPMKVAYHAPCHLERLGAAAYTIALLRAIPGLEVILLNSECCGIAGTYGFKKEYYDISQAVGSRLFEQIGQAAPDFVVTDCETCKWQIEMSTSYKVLHPVSLLARSLKKGP
jgi:glycerol-3-phosphate dehydrogenase subunit C